MQGKKIILAISGSIAAYKSAVLCRLLIKAGAQVQVLMTEGATQFITPLTLATLSKRPVFTEIISENSWNNHVELGLWADALVVAPATATTLAKLAQGIADNMVVATYLSARCPTFVAPAMDLDMWVHGSTRRNLAHLESDGVQMIPVEHGELASGLVGNGRMAEPENIVATLQQYFNRLNHHNDFEGKKILVTAGPTYEPIDPVRFIGNRSSGKMGIAIAENLAQRGAKVQLLLGPTALRPTNPNIETILVPTAQNMFEAAMERFAACDAAILSAAVADYRPENMATEKIKKTGDHLTLQLVKTPDIAAALGQQKQPHQRLIGFALETNDEIAHAQGKLQRKNFDAIVLNSLRDEGAGFAGDTNKITLLFADQHAQPMRSFDLKSKTAVAVDINDALLGLL